MKGKSVIILGGGLGGLFCGALLAKEGLKVTVLEKNVIPGGGLQSFRRFGEIFDTGMHVIGGMEPGGNIRRICAYLGLADQIQVKPVDGECTDRIYVAEDRKWYSIGAGAHFVESLSRYFPDERENLQHYVEALYAITEKMPLFNLRPRQGFVYPLPEAYTVAASELIERYIGNEKLRAICAYLNLFYAGSRDRTPAVIHAMVSVLNLNGPARFVEGSVQLAYRLQQVIEAHGGEVLTQHEVRQVLTEQKNVTQVLTADGSTYQADYFISAIHPRALLRMLDTPKAFPKCYRERLGTIPDTCSAFSVFIKFKERTFPYFNHSFFYLSRYDQAWTTGRVHDGWPAKFIAMTPPDQLSEQHYATKMMVTVPMSFDETEAWKSTTTGRRGQAYAEWKQQRVREVLHVLEQMFPGFTSHVEAVDSASPLTIRDYYGVDGGAMAGFSKDCHHIEFSQVPVATKLKNLLLTGQYNNLHGFCGVTLTAIQTAEALLGTNTVVNHINSSSL